MSKYLIKHPQIPTTEVDRLFTEAQDLFTTEFTRRTRQIAFSKSYFNFCCDESVKRIIIQMTRIIKNIPEFSTLSSKDIFIVIIFTYYSLALNEQTKDWLKTEFLERVLPEEHLVLALSLYFQITTGDIMVNGNDFSETIRRIFLGLPIQHKHTKAGGGGEGGGGSFGGGGEGSFGGGGGFSGEENAMVVETRLSKLNDALQRLNSKMDAKAAAEGGAMDLVGGKRKSKKTTTKKKKTKKTTIRRRKGKSKK